MTGPEDRDAPQPPRWFPMILVGREMIDGASDGPITLDRAQQHHIRQVLRKTDGDTVGLTDGEGSVAVGQIVGESISIERIDRIEPRQPALHLVQAVGPRTVVEEAVRSCTELGVDRITIVGSMRSDGRAFADPAKALSRIDRIIDAAVQQARHAWRPVADFVATIDELIESSAPLHGVVGDVHADGWPSIGRTGSPGGASIVAVGPPAGWDGRELDQLVAAGLQRGRLDTGVLRSEHAGLVLMTALRADLDLLHRPIGPQSVRSVSTSTS